MIGAFPEAAFATGADAVGDAHAPDAREDRRWRMADAEDAAPGACTTSSRGGRPRDPEADAELGARSRRDIREHVLHMQECGTCVVCLDAQREAAERARLDERSARGDAGSGPRGRVPETECEAYEGEP